MNNIQKKFIRDAIEDPSPLTQWEYDFIQNLASKENEYKLSEKQNDALNKISQKYL